MSVILETTLGDIVIDLFTDQRPKSCFNFLKLCKVKYYNFSLFHSVQRNFIAQTGQEFGNINEGWSIYSHMYGDQARFFEMESTPKIKHSCKGMVSFVNNGMNMHGSQFFITLADKLDYLDGKHTVFGLVSEGWEVLDAINAAACGKDLRPYQDIRISHTIILDDPYDDPKSVVFPCFSPPPTYDLCKTGRIGAGELYDDMEGKTDKDMKKMLEEREYKAGAQLLEILDDIPDAEMKPPENVLFVCKINPLTQESDLEIIFSRFGKILSCEIIKDRRTQRSLQYGFVEFEKVEDCEKAYVKMDNVLIDDRRIHVDFCQSIQKSRWNQSKMSRRYKQITSPPPPLSETHHRSRRSSRSPEKQDISYHRRDRHDRESSNHKRSYVQEDSSSNNKHYKHHRHHDRSTRY